MTTTEACAVTGSLPDHHSSFRFSLTALTTLFFMWGFITCMNDILIPHLKESFDLTYTQAMMIQFCFFAAYFIVSVPAGRLVQKIGHQQGIVAGLTVAGIGCLLFYPAAEYRIYELFLGALFVLASGITVLQVAANPYVTELGPPRTASARLNLTQGFNSLGTTLAPLIGGALILSAVTREGSSELASVQIPYLVLAAVMLLMAVIFYRLKLPSLNTTHSHTSNNTATSLRKYPHLLLGALAIFLYVGAEVSIGSFMVNFFALPHIGNMQEATAAQYVAWYWGGAMVGRFIGAGIMTRFRPHRVLMINALVAVAFLIIVLLTSGKTAMGALLLVGLCNSIMFPTIFSLALAGLGNDINRGSGILCLAIVGGAIIPLMQGLMADQVGVQLAFVLPALCFVYIALYGAFWSKLLKLSNTNSPDKNNFQERV